MTTLFGPSCDKCIYWQMPTGYPSTIHRCANIEMETYLLITNGEDGKDCRGFVDVEEEVEE